MTDFWKRTITGIVFVAVLLGAMLNPISSSLLFAVIAVLAVNEFYKLTRNDKDSFVNNIWGTLSAIFIMALIFFETNNHRFGNFRIPYINHICIICLFGILISALFLSVGELFRNKGNALKNWAYALLGQFLVIPFIMTIFLPYMPYNTFDVIYYNPNILYALFFCIWINDTGAYLVGCKFGKHRLFERISPKKSWEGFFGGAALAILIATFTFPFLFENSMMFWLGFSATVVVFGTLGDLMESLAKRSLGVKDSGNILPGHGGILDRFDSFMLAAPAVLFYLLFY